jgi:hypothetical protein
MPKPMYTICSHYSLEGSDNGLLSIIEIVEQIRLNAIPPPPERPAFLIVQASPFRITTAWLIMPDDDASADYEFEIKLISSDGAEVELAKQTSKFAKKVLKIIVVFSGVSLPIKTSGMLTVLSRMRKVGDQAWLSQEYPMLVEKPSP